MSRDTGPSSPEYGNHLVTKQAARALELGVAWIFAPSHLTRAAELFDLASIARKERSGDADLAPWLRSTHPGNGRQPASARAAPDSHQKCLKDIVNVVSKEDPPCPVASRAIVECRMSKPACIVGESAGTDARMDIHDGEFDSQTLAEFRAVLRFKIRLRAQMMVDVDRADA